MERVFSDDEKIQRAIEISRRRNERYNNTENSTRVNVNDNKKNYKFLKRLIIQLLICLVIYLFFNFITNNSYVFSAELISDTKKVLEYDVNIREIYGNVKEYILIKINEIKDINSTEENQQIENKQEVVEQDIDNTEYENTTNAEETIVEESNSISKTQMEIDAEEVKKICEFVKPLEGTVTSEFGEREVTSTVMSADHKGIDISANLGANIVSAISGTVTLSSENSKYGKYIKIENGDIMTVYAHCNELKTNTGDNVEKGQVIATVGSTGNSTGPHLHFEIRLSNRYINPRYVINF